MDEKALLLEQIEDLVFYGMIDSLKSEFYLEVMHDNSQRY
jgi:hypothetical protein